MPTLTAMGRSESVGSFTSAKAYRLTLLLLPLLCLVDVCVLRVNGQEDGGSAISTRCTPGHYYHLSDDGMEASCVPCGPGTFMDKDDHRERSCKRCTVYDVESPYYEVVDGCSPSHDVVTKCREGQYKDGMGKCQYCKNCEGLGLHFGQLCSTDFNYDAICCPEKGMHIRNGKCALPPDPTPGDDNGENTVRDSEKRPEVSGGEAEHTEQVMKRKPKVLNGEDEHTKHVLKLKPEVSNGEAEHTDNDKKNKPEVSTLYTSDIIGCVISLLPFVVILTCLCHLVYVCSKS